MLWSLTTVPGLNAAQTAALAAQTAALAAQVQFSAWVVNAIPGPASLGLLAPLGLVVTRRRR